MRVLDIDQITELFAQIAQEKNLSELVELEGLRSDQATLLEHITTMMPHAVIAERLELINNLLREVSQVEAEYITSQALPDEPAASRLRLEESLYHAQGLISLRTGEPTSYPQIAARQIGGDLVQLAKSTRVN